MHLLRKRYWWTKRSPTWEEKERRLRGVRWGMRRGKRCAWCRETHSRDSERGSSWEKKKSSPRKGRFVEKAESLANLQPEFLKGGNQVLKTREEKVAGMLRLAQPALLSKGELVRPRTTQSDQRENKKETPKREDLPERGKSYLVGEKKAKHKASALRGGRMPCSSWDVRPCPKSGGAVFPPKKREKKSEGRLLRER